MKIQTRMKMRAALLAGAIAAFSAARASAQPRMPTHVACVGDSITAGVGASSTATNYPADLQKLLGAGVQVQNFGHSGATMLSTGDIPYPRQVEYTNATTFVQNAGSGAIVDVIIMLGANDSKGYNWMSADGGTRVQQYASDCAALIDHFAGLPTHPVVYLALPLDALTNPYGISGAIIHNDMIPALNQLAVQKQLPTIDLNTPTAGHTEYFTDGVHPNDAGYHVVAQVMNDGLLRVPTVSLTAPMAGASVAGSVVGLAATASGGTVAIASVEFFRDATSLGSSTMAPFTLSWPNAATGSYSLTAKATDTTGAAATSAAVLITVAAGSGGSTGTAGASGSGGAPATGAGGATATGAGGATATGAGGAAATGAGGVPGEIVSPGTKSGCSCSLGAKAGAASGSLPLALLAMALAWRRRRRP
jgi:MYXO-CTERM domain-containing protein